MNSIEPIQYGFLGAFGHDQSVSYDSKKLELPKRALFGQACSLSERKNGRKTPCWYFFLNKGGREESVAEKLTGKWIRDDGDYTLDIESVNENGTLNASYFNPKPIELGRTEWMMYKNKLHVLVELKGPYVLSKCQLVYDAESKKLNGTFFQAVEQETYPIFFNKVE